MGDYFKKKQTFINGRQLRNYETRMIGIKHCQKGDNLKKKNLLRYNFRAKKTRNNTKGLRVLKSESNIYDSSNVSCALPGNHILLHIWHLSCHIIWKHFLTCIQLSISADGFCWSIQWCKYFCLQLIKFCLVAIQASIQYQNCIW